MSARLAPPSLVELWLHPVKSLSGGRTERARVGPRGIEGDREFALVDAEGVVQTAKHLPELLRLRARHVEGGALELALDGVGAVVVAEPRERGGRITTSLHRREVEAERVGDAGLEAFLRDALRALEVSAPCGPLSLARSSSGFFDARPLSLHSRATAVALDALAPGLSDSRRYRSNLVVDGCAERAEEHWPALEADGLVLCNLETIRRCSMTTVAPEDGSRGPEPLRELSRGRVAPRLGVYFLPTAEGELREGMSLRPTRP